MLFLGIISWKGVSCFNEGGGGVFQMGGIGFGGWDSTLPPIMGNPEQCPFANP